MRDPLHSSRVEYHPGNLEFDCPHFDCGDVVGIAFRRHSFANLCCRGDGLYRDRSVACGGHVANSPPHSSILDYSCRVGQARVSCWWVVVNLFDVKLHCVSALKSFRERRPTTRLGLLDPPYAIEHIDGNPFRIPSIVGTCSPFYICEFCIKSFF